MNPRLLMVGAIVVAGLMDFFANWLASTTLIPFGPYLVPGGTFLFSLSFAVYDYLRRQHGRRATVAAILVGLLVSFLYSSVFGGGIGRVALAGLAALCVSGPTDYLMQTLTMRYSTWLYVVLSNTVSLLLDTAVFTSLAFSILPDSVRVNIFEGQYLAKLLMLPVAVVLVYGFRGLTPTKAIRA